MIGVGTTDLFRKISSTTNLIGSLEIAVLGHVQFEASS